MVYARLDCLYLWIFDFILLDWPEPILGVHQRHQKRVTSRTRETIWWNGNLWKDEVEWRWLWFQIQQARVWYSKLQYILGCILTYLLVSSWRIRCRWLWYGWLRSSKNHSYDLLPFRHILLCYSLTQHAHCHHGRSIFS